MYLKKCMFVSMKPLYILLHEIQADLKKTLFNHSVGWMFALYWLFPACSLLGLCLLSARSLLGDYPKQRAS
jgi:hypothetical protein